VTDRAELTLPGALLRWYAGLSEGAPPWPAGYVFSFRQPCRSCGSPGDGEPLRAVLIAYDREHDEYRARWHR
jgi:hypothetical protein